MKPKPQRSRSPKRSSVEGEKMLLLYEASYHAVMAIKWLVEHPEEVRRACRAFQSWIGPVIKRPTSSKTSTKACHEVLGVASDASAEEILAAYKSHMKKCHPDKVAHLSDNLKMAAATEALELNQARDQAMAALGNSSTRPKKSLKKPRPHKRS
ncbi:MAG: J domain-containing protein [Terrimicrobiaceae bacterium]